MSNFQLQEEKQLNGYSVCISYITPVMIKFNFMNYAGKREKRKTFCIYKITNT